MVAPSSIFACYKHNCLFLIIYYNMVRWNSPPVRYNSAPGTTLFGPVVCLHFDTRESVWGGGIFPRPNGLGKIPYRPNRFPRADWQYKFLVTGLNPLRDIHNCNIDTHSTQYRTSWVFYYSSPNSHHVGEMWSQILSNAPARILQAQQCQYIILHMDKKNRFHWYTLPTASADYNFFEIILVRIMNCGSKVLWIFNQVCLVKDK